MTIPFYKLTAWVVSVAMIFTFAITASAADSVEEISGESLENTYSTTPKAQPKITEITFNSESPAYDAEKIHLLLQQTNLSSHILQATILTA